MGVKIKANFVLSARKSPVKLVKRKQTWSSTFMTFPLYSERVCIYNIQDTTVYVEKDLLYPVAFFPHLIGLAGSRFFFQLSLLNERVYSSQTSS